MDEAARPDLSVGAIAAAAGVHPVHLARVFRSAWGQSPADLLRWRRAEKALQMLANTRWSAAEIAAAAGFVDQSHLSRTLKTLFGVTPGECRRRMFRRYNTDEIERA
jgi:AraC family transcriptional regulator